MAWTAVQVAQQVVPGQQNWYNFCSMEARPLLFACVAASFVCVAVANICMLTIHAKILRRGGTPDAKPWNIGDAVLKRHSELYPDSNLRRWRNVSTVLALLFFISAMLAGLYMAVAPKAR